MKYFLIVLLSIHSAWAEPSQWTVTGSVNPPSTSYVNVGNTLDSQVNGINNFMNGKRQRAADMTAKADAHFSEVHQYAESVKADVQKAVQSAQSKRDTSAIPALEKQSMQSQESVNRSIDLKSI